MRLTHNFGYTWEKNKTGYIVENFPTDLAVIIREDAIFMIIGEKRGQFICAHAESVELTNDFLQLYETWKQHKTWTIEEMDAYYEKLQAFIQQVRYFKTGYHMKDNYYGELHPTVFIDEFGGPYSKEFDFFKEFEPELYYMSSCRWCDRYYHESESSAISPDYYCSSHCEERDD